MGRRTWGSYPSDSADGEAYLCDDQCPHACLMVTSENRVNDDEQINIKTLTHPHLKPLTALLHVRTINCTPSVTTTHDLKSFTTCTTLRFTPHATPRILPNRIIQDGYRVHEKNSDFDAKYEASCHCGKVKYQLNRREPLDSKLCHCTTCQTQHGSYHDTNRPHALLTSCSCTLPVGCYLPQGGHQLHQRPPRP
jgi:hypothetical protein